MITANLLGKCLLIGGAGAATGTGAYYLHKSYFSNNEKLMKLADKVGLVCKGNPTETFGVECTKKGGATDNIKVKKDSDLNVSAITGGKIKVYLKSKDEDYKDNFKFVIEDGDISTNDTSKKLEQFETYEIKEEGGVNKLIRKNEASKEIKLALGLPGDNTCNITTTTSGDGCTLDDAKLKKIKFEGLVEGEASVNSGTPKLKISKVGGGDYGTSGYKFVLESDKDTNLSKSLIIKKGTNTEFKIKRENGSLTLEKAWTVKSLGEKVGLICPETVTNGAGKCTLGASINVNNSENNGNDTTKKFTGLNKKDTAEKEVKFEIDKEGHSQGIKFFVEDEKDIELQGGSGGTDTNSKKLLKKDGGSNNQISYEIKKDGENWHLTKKTTSTTA